MQQSNLFLLFLVLATWNTKILAADGDTDSVVYVTAMFRHGDRTVDAGTVYPNDPYINETYYPYGIGQLTAKGKGREFGLGQLLRRRYDQLLEDAYTPDILEAIATNANRTKASLTLVLAGLYPPKGNVMQWNSNLNWQPIPYNYLDYEKDMWFTISTYFCPNYAREYALYLQGNEGRRMQAGYDRLLEYLRVSTGLNVSRAMETFSIFSCLQSQSEWGLKLPEWTKTVWPDALTKSTMDGLASGVATTKLKQLSGGFMVKRIVDNMKAKSKNMLDPEIRIMSLYSGHDVNIVFLLGALNVFTPHIVPYGACIIIELHKISQEYFVKVLYQDYTGDQPRTLTIPGCKQLCPLNQFDNLLKPNYPQGPDPCGTDLSVFDDFSQQRDYYCGRTRYESLLERYTGLIFDTRNQFEEEEAKSTRDGNTLLYVTSVFNHGDHTVDAGTIYPKDPYINETYFPYGLGQLTTKGKERGFNLGRRLRKRYSTFLGDVYMPDTLEAISTNMNRTKATLSLVLASVYPPNGNIMQWNANLNWQPIPYNYVDYDSDLWLSVPSYFCPNYAKEYTSYLRTQEGSRLQDKYKKLCEYLTENTGQNLMRAMDISSVYTRLQAQTEWGLTVPKWAEIAWPETLEKATMDALSSSVATTKLKQLSGGLLLKRVTDIMKARANYTLQPQAQKMSVYSGHDVNVVSLLGALNLFTPHIVKYASCVLLELHKVDEEHYVKVLYDDYSSDVPRVLTIPGCEELCPLSRFESILKPNYPVGTNPCGTDTSVFKDVKQRDYYRGKIRFRTGYKNFNRRNPNSKSKPGSKDKGWVWS